MVERLTRNCSQLPRWLISQNFVRKS